MAAVGYEDKLLTLLAKIKRDCRKVLDPESYEKVLKVIESYEAAIEEELARKPIP